MKLLFINPHFTEIYGNFSPAAKVGAVWPPLGLAYLASNIEGGHEVRILDCEIDPNLQGTLDEYKPDIVGITFTTPLYNQALNLFKYIKECNNNIWTIAGGPHPTVLPESVVSNENVDAVIMGEGEIAINKFLRNPQKGIFQPEPLIKDTDSIQFPARELLQNNKYLWSVPKKGIVPCTSFITSRGCPFLCTFCAQHLIFGRKMRYRSVENIISEMRIIKDQFKISHLFMLDDTLGLNLAKTHELCDAIIKEKLDITFEGYTRVNVITEDLLNRMKQAGLNRLSFGVESGNQHILDIVKKGTTLDEIRNAYEIADRVGIETRMSLILGLPGETEETIKNTIKFIKTLKCDQAFINIGTPFPGTDYYEDAKNGVMGLKLLTEDWKEYRRWGNAVINVNDLSSEDLIKWQKKALLSFYMRPRQIWYNLKRAGFKAACQNGMAFAKSFIK